VAVESRIDADDEWFVGEDRVLNFAMVKGDLTGFAGWSVVLELYPRRAVEGDAPVATWPGVPQPQTTPPSVSVLIPSATTATIPPGVYQYVLRRTDTGARAILAFGPADLRSAVNA
jgi:hypothetical protein